MFIIERCCATKSAEALDMLEKGQIKVRTDFSIEEKTVPVVTRITGYAVRALMLIALFIGSCLLCLSSAFIKDDATYTTVFRLLGLAGYALSAFFAFRLFRGMKKGK